MTDKKIEEETKTASEERKDQLAKRDPAHIAVNTSSAITGAGDGDGTSVLSRNLRLEPKDFNEMMVCAELAFKMQLGKCTSVADAAARIMRGSILGLDAMTSVDQLFIIGERLSTFARTLHGLVQQRSDCIECKVLEEECSATVAKVRCHRRGEPKPTVFVFTIEEAKQLVEPSKFTDKSANWFKDPKGMLIAKVLKRGIDRTWPGAFLGLSTVEDLRDQINVDPTTGEVRLERAGVEITQRDFPKELEGILADVEACTANADFQKVRKTITDWNAGDVFRKQALEAYNKKRTAWTAEQPKGETK